MFRIITIIIILHYGNNTMTIQCY